MKSFQQVYLESLNLPEIPWQKDPKIGWWKDHDHLTMYHGTHENRLGSIDKEGIKAPEHGSTKGWVSMTHDPHTAHGYASMSGGESNFRSAGAKAESVPHNKRVVLVAKIPREWAEKNMNSHLRGNIEGARNKLIDKSSYDSHKAAGQPDHSHYATTELRFKDHIPREFIQGYTKKPIK